MSQKLRVLKCLRCKIFQVDIIKKSKEWQCKVCRSKQSVGKELLRGSGAECRAKVQQLNMKFGQELRCNEDEILNFVSETNLSTLESKNSLKRKSLKTENKWSKYVDQDLSIAASANQNKKKAYEYKIDVSESPIYENKQNQAQHSTFVPQDNFSEWFSFAPTIAKTNHSKWENYI